MAWVCVQTATPGSPLYALKWRLFTLWCNERDLDPINCLLASELEFFSTGLASFTIKVYAAAVSVFHSPLRQGSVRKHPLVIRFLHGTFRMRLPSQARVLTCDLAIVLEGTLWAHWGQLGTFIPWASLLTCHYLSFSASPPCLEFVLGKFKGYFAFS